MAQLVLIRNSTWFIIHLATILVGFICIYDCLLLSFCSLFLITSGWIGICLCLIDTYLVIKTGNYIPKRNVNFFVACIKFTTTLLHLAITVWNIAGSIYIVKFLTGNLTGIDYTGKCYNIFTYAGIYLIVFWSTYPLGIFVVCRTNNVNNNSKKKKKNFAEATEMLNVTTDGSRVPNQSSSSARVPSNAVKV